jgi:plastocyanin
VRKWKGLSFVGVVVALGVTAGVAATSTAGTATVVKTFAPDKVVINQYIQSSDRYSPGTLSVKSGSLLTFEYGDSEQEPHTLTIVPKAQLPQTLAQINNCAACRLALPHLKSSMAPPGPGNPIVHWVLHAGAPVSDTSRGLGTVGDSVAIQPGGPHAQISIKVTAKPGTTLYFFCAIHPWMQGQIKVT